MELIYSIAEYLNIPNEWVIIDKVINNAAWFHVKNGTHYSCRTTRNNKYLKKNSIRID